MKEKLVFILLTLWSLNALSFENNELVKLRQSQKKILLLLQASANFFDNQKTTEDAKLLKIYSKEPNQLFYQYEIKKDFISRSKQKVTESFKLLEKNLKTFWCKNTAVKSGINIHYEYLTHDGAAFHHIYINGISCAKP